MPSPIAHQLALDLGRVPTPSLRNFFGDGNAEVVAALQSLLTALADPAAADRLAPGQRLVYLYGDAGSGRSHLLAAAQAAATTSGYPAIALGPQSPVAAFAAAQGVRLYTVDDVDALDPAQQIALFSLCNEVRANPHAALLTAGGDAPLGLAVREDLRTRLGWGLVYRLQPLSDDDKIAALRTAAHDRGLQLSTDVPQWLLNHFYRDMPSLMALLDALDAYSLERKRAVTLPLVRELLGALHDA